MLGRATAQQIAGAGSHKSSRASPEGPCCRAMAVDSRLSSPMSSSINDGIAKDLCSVRYASMDKALDLKRALGPGTKLVKMDLKEAYRVIPMTIIS